MVSTLSEIKRKKLTALVLLIDFEKAFDSVSVPCLVWKLNNYGVKGKLLRIIYSFLISRNVMLRVNSLVGFKRACFLLGVPQGSVLSPILFIIFIADLLKPGNLEGSIRDFTQCFKFADDGSVIVVGVTVIEARTRMQAVADYITKWCSKWRLVVNCSRNKTEVLIVKNKLTDDEKNSAVKIKITGTELEYVDKSKVLGITMDEKLTFEAHARTVLRNIWYAWNKLTDKMSRSKGLNTSSLCILFKTVVLTKLLYGSPVWLERNEGVFKSFMSKARLRITGAQFHHSKQLAEIMLGIPRLELLNQRVTVKFLLKSLFHNDDISARILQIEHTPGHRYYEHTILLKEFLREKHNRFNDARISRISLADIPQKDLRYSKHEVLAHVCRKWDREIINDMKAICREDNYRMDNEQRIEELVSFIKSFDAIQNTVFSRSSKRIDDTQLADFIHGHCLRFQDFTFSVQKADKTLHIPICIECGRLPDSPFHQLMECEKFDSSYRAQLEEVFGKFEINFHIPILFDKIPENPDSPVRVIQAGLGMEPQSTDASAVRKALRKQVRHICETSSFADQILC